MNGTKAYDSTVTIRAKAASRPNNIQRAGADIMGVVRAWNTNPAPIGPRTPMTSAPHHKNRGARTIEKTKIMAIKTGRRRYFESVPGAIRTIDSDKFITIKASNHGASAFASGCQTIPANTPAASMKVALLAIQSRTLRRIIGN